MGRPASSRVARAVVVEAEGEGAARLAVEVDTLGSHVEEDALLQVERAGRSADALDAGDGVLVLLAHLQDPVGIAAQQARHGHRGVALDIDLDAVDGGCLPRVVLVGLQDVVSVLVDVGQSVGAAPQGSGGGIEERQGRRALVGVGRREDLAQRAETLEQLAHVGVLVEEPLLVGVGRLGGQLAARPG